MKMLLTGIFIATAMLSGTPIQTDGTQAKVEMQVSADEVFQSKVKIFDYEGNLVKELKADDVANDDITITDYLFLESSDFAFQYLGDYYYFRD